MSEMKLSRLCLCIVIMKIPAICKSPDLGPGPGEIIAIFCRGRR